MAKMTVNDLGSVKSKSVLIRVDFNVPLKNGQVDDDTRIRAALPTIKLLIAGGARVILASHLGRPQGEVKPEFSLKPAGARLSELLKKDVAMAPDSIGPEVEKMVSELADGEVLLLENTRFHKGETLNDPEYARGLAALAEIAINDAFGTAHRAHASNVGVCSLLNPSVAGLLLQKEIEYFSKALESPKRPFVAVLGGAKVSDKIGVIENLLSKVNTLVIGGAMAYTFLKAQGVPVGASKVEEDKLELAAELLAKTAKAGVKLMLPTDHIVADAFAEDAQTQTVGLKGIPEGWMALDIGPKTLASFQAEIATAGTVVWNGPMGVFEMTPFAGGTMGLAQALAASEALSIVGGGDSVSAVEKSGIAQQIDHISTGGGASLELLEGKTLPGIAALTDK